MTIAPAEHSAEALFAMADQIEARFHAAQSQSRIGRITPSFPPSLGYGGTGLIRIIKSNQTG